MPLQLSVAGPDDLPGIVKAQYSAFHPNDTMHRLMYPSPHPVPEIIIERTIARQLRTMEDAHVTWVKIVDTESQTIVAAAKWIVWPPGQEVKEKRWPDKVNVTWVLPEEKGLNSGAGSDDQEYVEWIMEEFFGRRRERVQGAAALLDICFCAPSHHRRGAGKQLVEWGTGRADEVRLVGFSFSALSF